MKNSIERYRKENGWTQDELAEKVFTTKSTVSRWEKGISEPDINALKILSKIFNKSIDAILESTEGKEPSTKDIPIKTMGTSLKTFNSFYTGHKSDDDTNGALNRKTFGIFLFLAGIALIIVPLALIPVLNAIDEEKSPIGIVAAAVVFGMIFIVCGISLMNSYSKEQEKYYPNSVTNVYKKGITITYEKNSKAYNYKEVINIHQETKLGNHSRTGWTVLGGIDSVNTVTTVRDILEVWFDDGQKVYLQTVNASDLELIKTLKTS